MAITNLISSSTSPIVASLSALKSTFNIQNAWLGPNKYLIDTTTTIRADIDGGTINHSDLISYISASVSIHCFNGWSYLSSALNSFMEGDYANAIHNAYYAELRAIMSFLASQGIGVLNGENIIIEASGRATAALPRKLPTHKFAKEAFDQWLNYPPNAEKLLQSITVNNASLKEWTDITGFPPTSYMPAQVAANWIDSWSLDLNVIKKEQHFRNFVSYNPQTFGLNFSRQSENLVDKIAFLNDLWKLCSPNNLFSMSILRHTLEELYTNIFSVRLSSLTFESDWKSRLIDLGRDPYDATSQYLVKFLRREIEVDDNLVFKHAKGINFSTPIIESDTECMGIISRACLLLLMNTKIVETTLRQAGITTSHIKFWTDNIGLSWGYWDSASEPYLFSDLWPDIEHDLFQINGWMNNKSIFHTPYSFKTDLKLHLHNIRNLNKTYLWGI